MTAKNWLIFVAIVFAVAKEIKSACLCNEKGVDACGGCAGDRTVRPKQKCTEKPTAPLPPIGDSCSCSKIVIEPAALPAPFPKYQKPTTPCNCKISKPSYDLTSMLAPTPSAYYGPQVNYLPPAAAETAGAQSTKDDSVAADPISISLAKQAVKAVEVPEAKLAYGFVQKPIDDPPKEYFSSIEEENLYALKKKVITLKKSFAPNKQPEEEYVEADDEETVASDDNGEIPALTYKQLGYIQEQFKNPQFQVMASAYTQYANRQPVAVTDKVSKCCGYRSGRVSNYEQNKNACVGGCIKKMY